MKAKLIKKSITSIIEAIRGELLFARGKDKAFRFFVGPGRMKAEPRAKPTRNSSTNSAQKDACRIMIKTITWKNNTVVFN